MKAFIFRHRAFLLHSSFWILYCSYRVFDIYNFTGFNNALIYVGVPAVFNIVASYIHAGWILPLWVREKRTLAYAVRLALLIMIVLVLRMFAEKEILGTITQSQGYYDTIRFERVIGVLWDTLTFLLFTGMIQFTLNWFELENKKNQLENEKLVAELNYLKAQINPHFLFNTLHNLNYLVYSGSAKATEVIIKLSNIMRYMIYDASKERVPLSREIDYMNDYIHLERIRLNHQFTLTFNTTGNIHDTQVAPLILFTFLENAFKHGVSDQGPGNKISVSLHVTDALHCTFSNAKIIMPPGKKLKSGFGLDNVKKRLALSYGDRCSLDIVDTEDQYIVNLMLPLT